MGVGGDRWPDVLDCEPDRARLERRQLRCLAEDVAVELLVDPDLAGLVVHLGVNRVAAAAGIPFLRRDEDLFRSSGLVDLHIENAMLTEPGEGNARRIFAGRYAVWRQRDRQKTRARLRLSLGPIDRIEIAVGRDDDEAVAVGFNCATANPALLRNERCVHVSRDCDERGRHEVACGAARQLGAVPEQQHGSERDAEHR